MTKKYIEKLKKIADRLNEDLIKADLDNNAEAREVYIGIQNMLLLEFPELKKKYPHLLDIAEEIDMRLLSKIEILT